MGSARSEDGGGLLRYLASLFPPSPAPGTPGDPGLFGPGSQAWRIARERALLAAGPAALLMQLAHPLVSAGVTEHSAFSADPLHRLRATLDATVTVVFGDRDQARAAAARVGRRHRPVTGRTTAAVGTFPQGTPYRANDPALALWVHAALLWSALELVDGFVTRLRPGERTAYVREMAQFGRLFGVPEEVQLRAWDDLDAYVRAMVDGGTVAVGPQARALAQEILTGASAGLRPPLDAVVRAAARVLAAGLLPPRLRAAYGLAWGRRERGAFAAVRLATRLALPLVPPHLRYWPHHEVARRRLRDGSPRPEEP
ncbi:oxygenase MpaB family protein [Quadrisphaera sp. DSM 44207]|uniref:oxygenase MpaB family protein n=1 Tax=Quadrisphaera sp. DSM 44207 TaxID=1881057 RepID=UPI00087E5758|nr:oxygenase MpaB family protein [Quadrisphaera sp. DSM 44207]SDQ04431.1 Uncharacterized conserved protein, DUF2236 family [Quadrisphaera sp. DSM 44207]